MPNSLRCIPPVNLLIRLFPASSNTKPPIAVKKLPILLTSTPLNIDKAGFNESTKAVRFIPIAGNEFVTPSPTPPAKEPIILPTCLNIFAKVSPPDDIKSSKPGILDNAPKAVIIPVTPVSTRAILASPNNTTGIGIVPTIPANTDKTEPTVPSTPIIAVNSNIFFIPKSVDEEIVPTTKYKADIPAIIIAILANPLTTVNTGMFPTIPDKPAKAVPTTPRIVIALATLIKDLISDKFAIYGDTAITAVVISVNPPTIIAILVIPFKTVLTFALAIFFSGFVMLLTSSSDFEKRPATLFSPIIRGFTALKATKPPSK